MNTTELMLFLLIGYATTVAIELPVLMVGLSARHSVRTKLNAGFMLTALTYPIVVLVLPVLVMNPLGRTWYLLVAESFAPVAEVFFFRFIAGQQLVSRPDRDALTIVLANLLSFALGALFVSELILQLIRWLTG